jgi:hypothetical protein
MLNLTAPRVHTANASYYRKFELDGSVFARTNALFVGALQGGKQLTQAELAAALLQAGLNAASDDRLRLAYILMYAELDGVICSGSPCGKQQTYALLEERALQARSLEQDEALAKLTRRFFLSHGPATLFFLKLPKTSDQFSQPFPISCVNRIDANLNNLSAMSDR